MKATVRFFSQKEKRSGRIKCEVVKPGKYLYTHVSNKDLGRIKIYWTTWS